jgi:hypothetical protein
LNSHAPPELRTLRRGRPRILLAERYYFFSAVGEFRPELDGDFGTNGNRLAACPNTNFLGGVASYTGSGITKRLWSGRERLMKLKHINREASHLAGFSSGTSLGGKVSRYRVKENIYTEGAPADTSVLRAARARSTIDSSLVNVGSNWKAEVRLILINLDLCFIGSPICLATGPPLYDRAPRSSLGCSRPGCVLIVDRRFSLTSFPRPQIKA